MSFYFKYTGKRDAVLKKIREDGTIPGNIQKVCEDFLKEEKNAPSGIVVEGSGHYNNNDESAISNIHTISIVPIDLIE